MISFAVAAKEAFRICIGECNLEAGYTVVVHKLQVVGKEGTIRKIIAIQDSLNIEIQSITQDDKRYFPQTAEVSELREMHIDRKLIDKCPELSRRDSGDLSRFGKKTFTRGDGVIEILTRYLVRSCAGKFGK
jgi:hypothetical protein